MGNVVSLYVKKEKLVELLKTNVYHGDDRAVKPAEKNRLSAEQKAKLKRAFSEDSQWR